MQIRSSRGLADQVASKLKKEKLTHMFNRRRAIAAPLGTLVIFLLISSSAVVILGFGDQPYLKSARTQLQKARAHLYAGEDDKGGHRRNAMAYTSAAIDEVTAGLKSAPRHHAQVAADEIFATTSAGTAGPGSHMRKALVHLKQAQTNLAAATPDQSGHHAKAMDLINKAIVEVEKANAL